MASEQTEVLIIGAGIAGASLASRYEQLGISTCLVDEAAGPGLVTSRHDGAITHPALGRTASRLHKISLAAYQIVESEWANAWTSRGVFVLSKANTNIDSQAVKEKLKLLGIKETIGQYVSRVDAFKRFDIDRAGVWFPGAGSLNLGVACQKLISGSKNIKTIWSKKIAHIKINNGIWYALDDQHEVVASAKTIILANSLGAQKLLEPYGQNLYLKPVRGQLSIFALNKSSNTLKCIPKVNLSGDGYCIPPIYDEENQHYRWLVGSSYDENQDSLKPNDESDLHNRKLACGLLKPRKIDPNELHVVDYFVGIRCVSKDRLPLIGAIPNMKNIFVVTALGSRGLLWSTLASYVIPALTHSSAFALDRLARLGLDSESLAVLSPARFLGGAFASNSKPILPVASKAK